jgi:hypothetical protein
MTDQLAQAINGATVVIPYEDLKEAFNSEADLQNWCTFYGLQYSYNAQTHTYTIAKP